QLDKRRGSLKLSAPVRQLGVEAVGLEQLSLPHGVVAVLDRKRGQRWHPTVDEGLVPLGELAHEDAARPVVDDDVVQSEQQHVLIRSESKQRRAQKRSLLQVGR